VRLTSANAGAGRSQGFGFVQYALPEDAARVVEQEQGMELGGRKLKLELAVQSGARPKVERAKPKSQSAAQSAAPQAESAATARRVPDKASSVVLVTNLAPEITADKLEKVRCASLAHPRAPRSCCTCVATGLPPLRKSQRRSVAFSGDALCRVTVRAC
jgi:RNA recognition motif-containing protein